MKYSQKIREEELKNKVAVDFFGKYDCTGIIKDIDFAVRTGVSYLLWAEAKAAPSDIIAMLAQLVLTIGKARTFNDVLPPKFLGCFDCEKIAFIPYADIQDIFHQNDFNWKVPPSNRETREFKMIYGQIDKIVNNKTYSFDFEKYEKSLKLFILKNFMSDINITKIKIDKNNFISVYAKWLEAVKPTIAVNWDAAKKIGIIDGDFYLADLLSANNETIKEKLFVLLKSSIYKYNRHTDTLGEIFREAYFSDKQKAHTQFWAIYERPPKEAYWDYIIDRRNLLVSQDVRERKGSFFTPKIWVELSQKYITDVLGENWQEEYYVWDCAAGTGNLLAGLTNKYNVWASTLDKADVDVMHDRIENGANLLKEHCFQFDFLNDDFEKLPEGLRKIINDPKKRKKLVVYINPPYVEGDARIGKGRKGTQITKIREKYQKDLGKASGELFAQFFARVGHEISGCKFANFSTLKILSAPNFLDFRNFFMAKLKKYFIIPAYTFDNVIGQFPIGFFIWDTSDRKQFKQEFADAYNEKGNYIGRKGIFSYDGSKYISDWLEKYSQNISKNYIGYLSSIGNDFQHQSELFFNSIGRKKRAGGRHTMISKENLVICLICFSVRKCIEHTWLNHNDQFLYPNDGWEDDEEFRNDCITYALFHRHNSIQSKYGTNHWIPFTESEVNSQDKFESSFMTDFLSGKIKADKTADLFSKNSQTAHPPQTSRQIVPAFSGVPAARQAARMCVFAAGRELWEYYHAQPKSNVNASLYDIREHFQGRNANGKMNNKSDDETYNKLIGNLREVLKELAKKIEPKVYEYGFLKH